MVLYHISSATDRQNYFGKQNATPGHRQDLARSPSNMSVVALQVLPGCSRGSYVLDAPPYPDRALTILFHLSVGRLPRPCATFPHVFNISAVVLDSKALEAVDGAIFHSFLYKNIQDCNQASGGSSFFCVFAIGGNVARGCVPGMNAENRAFASSGSSSSTISCVTILARRRVRW